MNRAVLAGAFFMSCVLFAALGVWFWTKGDRLIAYVLLGMIPLEAFAFVLISRSLDSKA